MIRGTLLITATLLLALKPADAFAHAHLKSASPAPKSVLQMAPTEVAIDFTETLEVKFSSITVKDASGTQVDQGDVHSAPGDTKHLAVSLKPLQPGTYTVTWRATATDTHKSDGSFTFSVAK
jgi:methionine-rich copper-binding protein CopC